MQKFSTDANMTLDVHYALGEYFKPELGGMVIEIQPGRESIKITDGYTEWIVSIKRTTA